MVMARTVPASTFKAECLAMLDDVARSGEEILITKRGRPVARVVPAEPPGDLRGSVTFHVGEEELIEPLGEWDAERG